MKKKEVKYNDVHSLPTSNTVKGFCWLPVHCVLDQKNIKVKKWLSLFLYTSLSHVHSSLWYTSVENDCRRVMWINFSLPLSCFVDFWVSLFPASLAVSDAGLVWHFGKCAYSLSWRDFEEKTGTTHICLFNRFLSLVQRLDIGRQLACLCPRVTKSCYQYLYSSLINTLSCLFNFCKHGTVKATICHFTEGYEIRLSLTIFCLYFIETGQTGSWQLAGNQRWLQEVTDLQEIVGTKQL